MPQSQNGYRVWNCFAAACSIVAATVGPLAGGNSTRYLELAIVLTCLTGLLCIAGGLSGLGVIANFLSRPILTGYLNGIALTIIASQFGSLLGFSVADGGFFRKVVDTLTHLNQAHLPTLITGVSLLILLLLIKRFLPRVPAPLIAAALGCAAVYILNLTTKGVAVVGEVPAGFPAPLIPGVNAGEIWPLLFGAAGISLVSFCSMMTTARGFAAKNGYRIEVNRDMFALGVCDLASAFNRGFVVSGADSRTEHTRPNAPFPNMSWIPGGSFMMGSNEHYPEEAPAHPVTVDGFWMDQHTVTNAQFSRFVEETNYVTNAERAPRVEDYPGAKLEMLVPGVSCILPAGRCG